MVDWTSVWAAAPAAASALAAIASAATAIIVARREWGPPRLQWVAPPCWWVGYRIKEGQQPRPALALLIAVENLRGVSSLVRDLFVTAQADSWERPLRLQPEFQVDIGDAITNYWERVELFAPIGVHSRGVVSRVIIFAHRAFCDDPPTRWVAGEYTVRGLVTESGPPELFVAHFRLERPISPTDDQELRVLAKDFRLTPRRWAKDILEARDRLGRAVYHERHKARWRPWMVRQDGLHLVFGQQRHGRK